MTRILITGMSGSGKSSLLEELSHRGVGTIDTDYGDYVLPNGLWDAAKMNLLLATHADIVVSGTVENQIDFYDSFNHIVLLSAPIEVLLDRVSRRTNNPYGTSMQQQHEIRHFIAKVEPLLRSRATMELDGQRPLPDLADAIQRMMQT